MCCDVVCYFDDTEILMLYRYSNVCGKLLDHGSVGTLLGLKWENHLVGGLWSLTVVTTFCMYFFAVVLLLLLLLILLLLLKHKLPWRSQEALGC